MKALRVDPKDMMKMARIFILRVYREKTGTVAAALSFYTLVAMLPISVLGLYLLRHTPALGDQMAGVRAFLLSRFAGPGTGDGIKGFLDTLEGHLEVLASGWSGAIALIFLLVTATILFVHVERSLNRIWGAPRGRGILARVATLWTWLTLVPLLLAISFRLAGSTQSWVGLGMNLVGFFLLELLLPNTRVKILPALGGALLVTTGWEGARFLLSSYVVWLRHSSILGAVYGSLSFFPVMLLWVYYTWILVLVGAHFAHMVQHARRLRVEDRYNYIRDEGWRPLAEKVVKWMWRVLDQDLKSTPPGSSMENPSW